MLINPKTVVHLDVIIEFYIFLEGDHCFDCPAYRYFYLDGESLLEQEIFYFFLLQYYFELGD